MPIVSRNGVDLYYSDSGGKGRPVILQHPLTADGESFGANGVADALLSAGYRCIVTDSIAHGRSGRPAEQSRYALAERVADILAVADDAGIEGFRFVGYSMGAWIGTGLLELAAERLHRVVLAGWDPIEGGRLFTAETDPDLRAEGFRKIMRTLSQSHPPHRIIEDDRLEGYIRCFNELFDNLPPLACLGRDNIPVALYCGTGDPYIEHVRKAAATLGLACCEAPGDHASAFMQPDFAAFIREQFAAQDASSQRAGAN